MTSDFTTEAATYDVIVDCVGNAPFRRVRHLLAPSGALLLVVADLSGLVSAGWHTRRTGIRVTASPGPYRPEDLAHLVRLADAGHYHPGPRRDVRPVRHRRGSPPGGRRPQAGQRRRTHHRRASHKHAEPAYKCPATAAGQTHPGAPGAE